MADLSLTNADSPDPVHRGDNITYTLTVANAGPDAAADVTISDNLPPGVAFVSASPDCSLSADTVTCSVGTLAAGANEVHTITVQTTSANGSLHNTASVSSSTSDPDAPDDRTATATTTVNPAASLALTMTDTTDPAERGEELGYGLTVANTGPDPAEGVSVTVSLPSGVVYQRGSSLCSHSSGVVTCNLSSLPSGWSHDFLIVVRPTSVGQISTAAVASTTTHDRSTGNDSDTETTQVVDTVAPTPTLSDPAQNSTTTDATPRFAGSSFMRIGDSSTVTVKIYAGHAQTQQDLPATPTRTLTTTQNAGNYEVTPSDTLPNGQYTAQAEQSDNGGNTGKSGLVRFTVNAPLPPVDSDGDGIFDHHDPCPAEKGSLNGCNPPPPPDEDGDGTPDHSDNCRTLSGSGDPSRPGCPPFGGTPTIRTEPVQITPQGVLFKATGNSGGRGGAVKFEISMFEDFELSGVEERTETNCYQKTGQKDPNGKDLHDSEFSIAPFGADGSAYYRDFEVTCLSDPDADGGAKRFLTSGRKLYVRAILRYFEEGYATGKNLFGNAQSYGGGGGGGGSSTPTNTNDVLNGTDTAETICGLLGNDVVNAAGGNDTVFGDVCNVKAKPVAGAQAGAGGNDTLNGGTGNDTVYGAGGADKLFGDDGNDKLFGGDGNDSLSGGKGKDSLDGGKGNDKLTGGADVNTYKGGSGDDTVNAKNGKVETVDCGAGKKDSASVDKRDKVKGCEKVKRAKK